MLGRLTTTALALGALATGLVLGPAGAANAAAPQQPTTTQATTPTGVKPLASSPSVSPGANKTYYTNNGSPGCPDNNLCAVVWDWTTSSWKVFELYACHRYTVYNWLGGGVLINNQRPYGSASTTAHLYNGSGNEIGTGYAARAQTYSVNWDPVGSVQNCY